MNAGGGFHLPTRRHKSALHFVPLIDLMFILLMVFLLIAQPGQYAWSGRRAFDANNRHEKISVRVIRVSPDGTLMLDGQQTDIMRLPALLEAKGSDAAQTIILRPEGGVRLKSLKDALLAIDAIESVRSLSLRIAIPADNGSGDAK